MTFVLTAGVLSPTHVIAHKNVASKMSDTESSIRWNSNSDESLIDFSGVTDIETVA